MTAAAGRRPGAAPYGGGPERAAALLKWKAARIIIRGRGALDDKWAQVTRETQITRGEQKTRESETVTQDARVPGPGPWAWVPGPSVSPHIEAYH